VRIISTKYPNIKIWGIGHSLGAHLLGQSGRLSKAFYRITALDTAGPTFANQQTNQYRRIRESDANIIDVIHTCGYNVLPFYYIFFASFYDSYGTLSPLGTVDFYPNYGHSQPGCSSTRCNHNRAIELFIWSVRNGGKFITNSLLKSKPDYMKPVYQIVNTNASCKMGFHFDSNPVNGDYYIKTNDNEPWV
jgi:hypothetical protein